MLRYAVDSDCAVTMLGPVEVANGVGTLLDHATTRFMLFASPEANVTHTIHTRESFSAAQFQPGLTVIVQRHGGAREQVAEVLYQQPRAQC